MRVRIAEFAQTNIAKVLLLLLIILLLWLMLFAWLFPPQSTTIKFSQQLNEPSSGQWLWFEVNRKAPPKNVKRSKLEADLVGLIYTEDKRVAIISTASAKFKVYKEGGKIKNGIYVKEIYPDRVILDEYGVERELIPKREKNAMKLIDKDSKQAEGNEIFSSSDSADSDLSLPKGLGEFADIINVLPVKTPEGSTGLKLQGLNEDLVDLSGLDVNDVVVNVNSQPINSIINNPKAIQELMKQGEVAVDIVRNGEPTTINVDVRTLAARVIPLIGNRSLR